jgi:hypothetical protein
MAAVLTSLMVSTQGSASLLKALEEAQVIQRMS